MVKRHQQVSSKDLLSSFMKILLDRLKLPNQYRLSLYFLVAEPPFLVRGTKRPDSHLVSSVFNQLTSNMFLLGRFFKDRGPNWEVFIFCFPLFLMPGKQI